MQLGVLLPGKPEWYDRDPIPKRQSFANNGIVPHAATVQWIYTVPTNRKAWLAHAYIDMVRATAAAPVGRAVAAVQTVDGGVNVVVCRIIFQDNTLGNTQRIAASPQYMLEAGVSLRGQTTDPSTGGTLDIVVAAHMSEFNLE